MTGSDGYFYVYAQMDQTGRVTAVLIDTDHAWVQPDNPDAETWPPDAPKTRPVAEFVECVECQKKPGTPDLCADCLRRRAEWERTLPENA